MYNILDMNRYVFAGLFVLIWVGSSDVGGGGRGRAVVVQGMSAVRRFWAPSTDDGVAIICGQDPADGIDEWHP